MDQDITRRKAIQTLSVGGITVALSGCQGMLSEMIDMNTNTQDRHGPMRTGRFTVQINDTEIAGFQHVKIPGSSTERDEYRDGSDPDYEKKLWGKTTYDELELVRGFVPGDPVLREWKDDVIAGKVDSGRKKVTVSLMNEDGEAVIEWQFSNSWITEYEPPELDANAEENVGTEAVTVAFDKMVRTEV
ncbi:phage tail protein [Natrinema halophilum]|uniref:Phage tail protein n=1 Tax=Natrinema halophilum TaxID=1699371 RepID=A0A7D5KBV5_9EURY|nr:phage tail protein [Natrinema halophilum]QLG48116.1 phage tail protein [Natrinema halophilum]